MDRDELADVLSILTTEIVAACIKSSPEADAALEDIASQLLTFSDNLIAGNRKDFIGMIARRLIQTESGAV